MAKSTTQSFVVTRRIITGKRGYDKLNKIERITERMYNAGVRHCIKQLVELKKDVWYKYCLGQFFACRDEKESKQWSREIFICAAAYQLTEYDLHAYFGRGKASGYEGGIGINIVQKTATALYSAVKKAVFGKKIHFRKYEETFSFEDKKAASGIIYKPETDTVTVCGTVFNLKPVHIKGMRIQYSESMKRSKMRLRTAYRKQRVYVGQSNNKLANEWLGASGSVVKIETMNYKDLQKRSSKTERQDKKSVVTDRTGRKRSIRKFKRRKRFGGSILKHAPSGFLSTIKRKVTATCGVVADVSASKLKASQYDHASDSYEKVSLSDREKMIDGHMVQRDCYSSFIIFHATDENKPDREGCLNGFEKFLVCQDELIKEMIHDNFSNPNFGTKLINIKKQLLHEEPAAV